MLQNPCFCCRDPEVSRQGFRSNRVPGKQPPQGPPLKGCIRSHSRVLCSLRARIRLCHSLPLPPESELVAATSTVLPVIGPHRSFFRARENPRRCLQRPLLRWQRHPLPVSRVWMHPVPVPWASATDYLPRPCSVNWLVERLLLREALLDHPSPQWLAPPPPSSQRV